MQKIHDLSQLSELITAQWKKGVVSNAAFSAAAFASDIQNQNLFAEVLPGALLLLRRRDGYDRLSFYLQPESELSAFQPERTTVCEIPRRNTDEVLRLAQMRFERLGFQPRLLRQRMELKRKISDMPVPAGYTLRLAELQELSAVQSILRTGYDPVTSCLPTEEELKEQIQAGHVLVAASDLEHVVGVLHVLRSGHTMEIRQLVVEKEHRGRGVATALLARIDAMYDVKCTKLWTAQDNFTAIRVYERLGYACDGWTSCVLSYHTERN